MGQRPFWRSRMEASCCTFRFGTIIRRDLRTLLLPRVLPCDNLHACVIYVHARKATHTLQNCLVGLEQKIQRYNNLPPYMTARWPPRQIPPQNFFGSIRSLHDQLAIKGPYADHILIPRAQPEVVYFLISNESPSFLIVNPKFQLQILCCFGVITKKCEIKWYTRKQFLMYFHNSLIPRVAYFLLPLESKQEATSGWNFTKCISEVKVNQLKVKKIYMLKWAHPPLSTQIVTLVSPHTFMLIAYMKSCIFERYNYNFICESTNLQVKCQSTAHITPKSTQFQ